MSTPMCELCANEAKLICYCRKALLCDLCVGRHFLSEASLSHKPLALSQAAIYEETLPSLRENEERLMEEILAREELFKAARDRLQVAKSKLHEISLQVDESVDSIQREVITAVEHMREDLKHQLETEKHVLEEAETHFSNSGKHAENPIVRVIEDGKNTEEIAGLEIVQGRVDVNMGNIGQEIRKTVTLVLEMVAPRKLPHSKTADLKKNAHEVGGKVIGKSSIPVKKQSTVTHHASTLSHTSSIPKKGKPDSKPQVYLTAAKKDSQGRRASAVIASPFPLVPDLEDDCVKSDEDFDLLAEDPPPLPLLKLPTEVPKRTSPSPTRISTGKSTTTRHKKSEEDSKPRRPVSDSFGPLAHEGRGKLIPPTLTVTSPDGERKMRSPRRSSTLEETPPKPKSIVCRATEISRSPSSFTPPEESPKSGGMSLPQQTFVIPPQGKAIIVLDLESNVTAVKEFALPESELFGDDLAWCSTLYGEVFLLGGRSHSTVLDAVYLYNSGADELETGTPLLTARYRHCALCHQDTIYVIGGIGVNGGLRDCEKFEIRRKTWKKVGNLAIPRESHSACIFEGKIYIAGGTHTDTIEVIVPLLETFSVIHLKSSCSGPTTLLSDGEKLVLLQGNSIIWLYPNDRLTREVGKLPEYDWWCSGPPVLHNTWHYLVRQGQLYRFNTQTSDMVKLILP